MVRIFQWISHQREALECSRDPPDSSWRGSSRRAHSRPPSGPPPGVTVSQEMGLGFRISFQSQMHDLSYLNRTSHTLEELIALLFLFLHPELSFNSLSIVTNSPHSSLRADPHSLSSPLTCIQWTVDVCCLLSTPDAAYCRTTKTETEICLLQSYCYYSII